MSKELTEKWRNCTLPNGVYYLQYDNCLTFIYNSYQMIDLKKCKDSDKVQVLAPVPSYDEYKNMADEMDKFSDLLTRANKNWTKTIKENKKLKEQLLEANNIIVKADWDCDYGLQKKCGFSEYLKKYNIEGIK